MRFEQRLRYCAIIAVSTVAIELMGEEAVAELKNVTPHDNQAELRNPGMGFCLYYYTNFTACYGARLAPTDLLNYWPGLTTVYMRIPWCFVEPEEGKFDWSIVDTPMQRFAEGGLKAAFRFTCSENGSEAEYATPKWVKNAGAKFYEHGNPELPGRKETTWEPDFADPVFLEKLDHFLAALAARYDGHPDVAFVDIGSFGVWGEGHTWGSTGRIYPGDWPDEVRNHGSGLDLLYGEKQGRPSRR